MRKYTPILPFAIVCVMLFLTVGHAKLQAKEATSADGYVRSDERTSTWTVGTSMVEQRLQLAKGVFALTSFENKLAHRQKQHG